jgi:hypothetical protein
MWAMARRRWSIWAALVPGCDSGEGHPAMRGGPGYLSLSRQQHRQEREANRQRRAFSLAGVATRPAQRISALAQLWPSAFQLQAPPTADDAAHRLEHELANVLRTGYADLGATATERAPEAQVQMLRIGDGDLAKANHAADIHGWCSITPWRQIRGTYRGTHELITRRDLRQPTTCPEGVLAILGLNKASRI